MTSPKGQQNVHNKQNVSSNLMISHSSSTVLFSSGPPSAATPSLGDEGNLTDDSLLAASWALN